jgi:hypothetical protein
LKFLASLPSLLTQGLNDIGHILLLVDIGAAYSPVLSRDLTLVSNRCSSTSPTRVDTLEPSLATKRAWLDVITPGQVFQGAKLCLCFVHALLQDFYTGFRSNGEVLAN